MEFPGEFYEMWMPWYHPQKFWFKWLGCGLYMGQFESSPGNASTQQSMRSTVPEKLSSSPAHFAFPVKLLSADAWAEAAIEASVTCSPGVLVRSKISPLCFSGHSLHFGMVQASRRLFTLSFSALVGVCPYSSVLLCVSFLLSVRHCFCLVESPRVRENEIRKFWLC